MHVKIYTVFHVMLNGDSTFICRNAKWGLGDHLWELIWMAGQD